MITHWHILEMFVSVVLVILSATPHAYADDRPPFLQTSNTSSQASTNNQISLEGIWQSHLPDVALITSGDGKIRGRQIQEDPACGTSPGTEILRAHLDEAGGISGEIRICAESQCPGLAPWWLYFIAVASADGSQIKGVVPPSAYKGCDVFFNGFQIEAIKVAPLTPETTPARLEPKQDNSEAIVASAAECALVSPQGILDFIDMPEGKTELTVDDADWIAPYKRVITSGVHTVSLHSSDYTPESVQICVPGGRVPTVIDLKKIFKKLSVPTSNASKKVERVRAHEARGNNSKSSVSAAEKAERKRGKIEKIESDACPTSGSTKKHPMKLTFREPPEHIVIDSNETKRNIGSKSATIYLTAGEHTILVRFLNSSMEEMKKVCVRANQKPPPTLSF